MQDAAKRLGELIDGYWITQAINTACHLRIPDALGEGPKDAQALAAAASAHAPSVERLMRALRSLDLVEPAGAAWRLTATGDLLRADAAKSMRGRAMFSGGLLYKQFGDLLEVVRTGERSKVVPKFEELDPQTTAVFQRAMAEGSLETARFAAEVCDFGRFEALLDVGGGYGGVLAALLARHPALRGDVYDIPANQAGAEAFLAETGVTGRGGFIPGDFFESVPSGYDCYLLKFILHDWNDDRCHAILESCRGAIGPLGRLIVIEQIVPDDPRPVPEHRTIIRGDLTMLTVDGKERTAVEYHDLLAGAGFALAGIAPTRNHFAVIEAIPA